MPAHAHDLYGNAPDQAPVAARQALHAWDGGGPRAPGPGGRRRRAMSQLCPDAPRDALIATVKALAQQ